MKYSKTINKKLYLLGEINKKNTVKKFTYNNTKNEMLLLYFIN